MAPQIKSARIEGARWRPSSVAFASGFMETHLLTGERNISPQSHRGTLRCRECALLPKTHPFTTNQYVVAA